jgi:cation diffusion facilitator CzcD-associated flavoprotein CzcO
MDKLKVVVVGAGAAGLAAAARLMEHGVRNVVILEAEDRMGGRIHTTLCGKLFLLLYLYFTTLVTDQEYEINYNSVQFY